MSQVDYSIKAFMVYGSVESEGRLIVGNHVVYLDSGAANFFLYVKTGEEITNWVYGGENYTIAVEDISFIATVKDFFMIEAIREDS